MAKTCGDIKNMSGLSTGAKSKYITETVSLEALRTPNSSEERIGPEEEAEEYT